MRQKKNLSLERMAMLLGYESLNGYYYLEIGRSNFSAENLAKVADILEVRLRIYFFENKIAEMVINLRGGL